MSNRRSNTGHGTKYRYKAGCRCTVCRAGNTARQMKSLEEKREALRQEPGLRPHGNASTYKNWGCRCQPCTDAANVQRRALQIRRRKEKGLPPIDDIFSKPDKTHARAYTYIPPFGREWLNEDDSVRT